eukprot:4300320-Amphidinium_carterae.1
MYLAHVKAFEDGIIEVEALQDLSAPASGRTRSAVQYHTFEAGACIGFIMVEDGCGISYEALPGLLNQQEGVMYYKWDRQMVLGLPAALNTSDVYATYMRRYAIAVKMVDVSEFAENVHREIMLRMGWQAFRRTLVESTDWLSTEMNRSVMAVSNLLRSAGDGAEKSVLQVSWRYLLMNLHQPDHSEQAIFWTEQYFLIMMYHMVKLVQSWDDVAVTSEILSEMRKELASAWASDFLLPNHRAFTAGFGYYDAVALANHELWPAGITPRTAAPGSLLLTLLRGGCSRAGPVKVPLPLPGLSWWTPPWYDALGSLPLETHRAAGGSHGLHVILIDTHHTQYQELRALMNRVSEELLGEAGRFDTYCLRMEGQQHSSLALWGSLGPPANVRGNATLEFLDVEHGLEKGIGEVARWTTAPEWDDADLVA